jgi:UPF0716 protein FxsA
MNMRPWLPLVFILFPFIEIYLLIKVGREIDAIPTIFLIVFTGVLGALLLRHQGFFTLRQMQKSMDKGELPAMAMIEGVMLIFSGVLLLIPGFLTDIVGVLLLVPHVRKFLIQKFFQHQFPFAPGVVPGKSHEGRTFTSDKDGHTIIDGECRREDDNNK